MSLFKSDSGPAVLHGIPLKAAAVQTLLTSADFRTVLLAKIAAAAHRIYLCSLYLQNDEAGAEVLQALYAAKAARPELDIVVTVDWHRAQRGLIGAAKSGGNAAWYQELSKQRGHAVPIYGVPVQTRELFGVLHLKGFVIDDQVIYSGASLNNVYLHKQDKYRHDRYLLIQNKVLADSMVKFIREHLLSSAAVHRLDMPEVPTTRSIRGEIKQLRSKLKAARYDRDVAEQEPDKHGLSVTPLVGLGKNNPLNNVICQLLAASKTQITICTPYFNFPSPVAREISGALKRGVRICIIVGDKTANDFFIPPEEPFKVISALPYLYEVKLRHFAKSHQAEISSKQLQLRLWKDGDNTYHLKGMWIDEDYALVTGNNLNPRAFRLDLENALLIHDPKHELQQQRAVELNSILEKTKVISDYRELQETADYPESVRKLLGGLGGTRLDRLAYRVL